MPKISPNKCLKCGGFKLDRPDKVPFCTECEKKLKQEFVRLRPDKKKQVFFSQVE